MENILRYLVKLNLLLINMRLILNKNIFFILLFIIYFKSVFANERQHQFNIEADKSIEYFEKEKTYVASGSAKASKG